MPTAVSGLGQSTMWSIDQSAGEQPLVVQIPKSAPHPVQVLAPTIAQVNAVLNELKRVND